MQMKSLPILRKLWQRIMPNLFKGFLKFFLALNIFQLGGVNLNRESVYTGSNLNFLVAGDKTILKSMPCMLLNIVAEECAYNTCHNAHSILYYLFSANCILTFCVLFFLY